MKTELERYKEAVKYLSARCNISRETQKSVDDIINPPPEFETVDANGWFYEETGVFRTYEPVNKAGWIKGTLTTTRLKPQIVQSVSARAYITPEGEVKLSTKDGYTNYPIFKTNEDVHHKTGTLTFTPE